MQITSNSKGSPKVPKAPLQWPPSSKEGMEEKLEAKICVETILDKAPGKAFSKEDLMVLLISTALALMLGVVASFTQIILTGQWSKNRTDTTKSGVLI